MKFTCLDVAKAALGAPQKQSGDELHYRCPVHDDHDPSLMVNSKKDVWLCGPCNRGGTPWELAAFLAGFDPSDKESVKGWLQEHQLLNGGQSVIVSESIYQNPDRSPALKVIRYDPKGFRQQRWDGTSWNWKGQKPKLLYHLPELLAEPHRMALLPEGEKDVDRLISLGFLATCNPGGAGNWDTSYTETLKGHPVAILPDNDPPGHAHAVKVAQALFKGGCEVRIVELPVEEKGDVSDWLDAGHTAEELKAVISKTQVLDETGLAALDTRSLKETQRQTSSIAEILTKAGFDELTKDSSGDDIERMVRNLPQLLDGADRVRLAVIREEASKKLKAIGVSSTKPLLDAVLNTGSSSDTTSEEGQGKVMVMAEPGLWPDPVDGRELLDDIAATFRRFIVLTESAVPALALWSVHTHALKASQISPILGVTSPEKRCAKTLTLEILEQVVFKPLPTANISTAAVFRTVEKYAPTLLIDEADTFLKQNEELRGVLNSGHRRSAAVIVRTVGDDHEPRTFSTWCPKAVALIGKLPGTLEDRSIIIRQERKGPGERVERWRRDRIPREVETLKSRVARWVNDHLSELKEADPKIPQKLNSNDRAADNWRPLLAIADAAGGKWPKLAREAAETLSGETSEEENSARIQLLADFRDLFDSRGVDQIQSSAIADALIEMEERPWPEWRRGKPITTRQLASLLKPFGIGPKQVWIDGKKSRGYEKSDFQEAFSRYLPPPDPVGPVGPSTDGGLRHLNDPVGNGNPTGSKNDGNQHEQSVLPVLPDGEGVSGKEAQETTSGDGDL